MKQLLFLLLFPCLCVAQYTGNAGQKITLGEQTTADGLVFRGRLADTANLLTNKLDTSVYIVLDTGTRAMWYYRASTTPKWTRLVDSLNNMQGQLSLTTKVTGTLPVANGGTNASTFTAGSVVFAGASGTYTQDNSGLFYDNTNDRLGIGTASPSNKLNIVGQHAQSISLESYSNTYPDYQGEPTLSLNKSASNNIGTKTDTRDNENLGSVPFQGVVNSAFRTAAYLRVTQTGVVGAENIPAKFGFYTSDGTNSATERMTIASSGAVTIANLAGINDVGADANGKLQAATSDINLKNTIEDSPFGLNEILVLNPVTFLYNDENRKIDSDVKEVGFIAQDVFDIIPNAVSSTGTGDLQLDYRAITASLVKAIQEQNALIKSLEQRILILENK